MSSGNYNLWVVTSEDSEKYERWFRTLGPVEDKLNGKIVRNYLLRTKLDNNKLAEIWQLSDSDTDGYLNISEFMVAVKLVEMTLKGYPIPSRVPTELRNSIQQILNNKTKKVVINYDYLSELFRSEDKEDKKVDSNFSYRTQVYSPVRDAFENLKSPAHQVVTGEAARDYFLKSGLDRVILAKIWDESDQDKDGCLNFSEFTIAYNLIQKYLSDASSNRPILQTCMSMQNITTLTSSVSDSTQSTISLQKMQTIDDSRIVYPTERIKHVPAVDPTSIKLTQRLESLISKENATIKTTSEIFQNLKRKEQNLTKKKMDLKNEITSLENSNQQMTECISEQNKAIAQISQHKNATRIQDKPQTKDIDDILELFNVNAPPSNNSTIDSKHLNKNTNDSQIDIFDFYQVQNSNPLQKSTLNQSPNHDVDQLYAEMAKCKNLTQNESHSEQKFAMSHINKSYNADETGQVDRSVSQTKSKPRKMYSSPFGDSVDNDPQSSVHSQNHQRGSVEPPEKKEPPMDQRNKDKPGFKMKNPFKKIVRGLSVHRKNKKKTSKYSSEEIIESEHKTPPIPEKPEMIQPSNRLPPTTDQPSSPVIITSYDIIHSEKSPKTTQQLESFALPHQDFSNDLFSVNDDRNRLQARNNDISDSASEFVSPNQSCDESDHSQEVESYHPPLTVKAIKNFISDDSSFSFKPNDILHITHRSGGYYYAEINEAGDWFPCEFVQIYHSRSSTFNEKYSLDQFCTALYDNDVENADDLPFNEGDIIQILDDMGEWLKGYSNGTEGMVPKNYTESLTMLHVQDTEYVIYDYLSTHECELNLKQNQKVAILHKSSSGWCIGVDQNSKIGWFPIDCVNQIQT